MITVTFDPETHKVVPLEPTPKMVDTTYDDNLSTLSHNNRNKHIYRKMIAVAPDLAPIAAPDTNPLSMSMFANRADYNEAVAKQSEISDGLIYERVSKATAPEELLALSAKLNATIEAYIKEST